MGSERLNWKSGIEARAVLIIAGHFNFNPDGIPHIDRFVEYFGVDSPDAVDLLMAFEN